MPSILHKYTLYIHMYICTWFPICYPCFLLWSSFCFDRCFPSLISRPRSSELCRGPGTLLLLLLLLQSKRPRNRKEMVSSRDPNLIHHRNSIAHFSQQVPISLHIFVSFFFPFLYSLYKYVVGVSLLLKLHQIFGEKKKMHSLFL